MSRKNEGRIVGDNIRGEMESHIMQALASYLRTLAFTLVEMRLEGFEQVTDVICHLLREG